MLARFRKPSNYTLFETKMAEIDTLSPTKTAKPAWQASKGEGKGKDALANHGKIGRGRIAGR